MKYKTITVETIVKECLSESLSSWHKELWYDKNTEEFSFSEWLTQNSWNESSGAHDLHVCNFDSISLTDNDSIRHLDIFEDIETEDLEDFVIDNCAEYYLCYDGNNFISKDFPLINQTEKITCDLSQYSILNENEAIEALINIIEVNGWYEDELNHIYHIEKAIIDQNCMGCNIY